MLDQSFSYENLKEIYDIEKRKGHSLDGMLLSADRIAVINTQIKDIYKEIRRRKHEFSKKISAKRKTILNTEIDQFEDQLTAAKDSKKNLLRQELGAISDNINSDTFLVSLRKTENFLDSKKPLYLVQDDIKGFLFIKHIQKQLNSLYKIKQSNRYLIVSQVIELLTNQTSLFNVIKFDIKNFYESIPLEDLEKKLVADDNLLSPKIKKHISSILTQYKTLSGSEMGVPRGIGLSAYLGELYMRDFDRSMRSDEEVFFYARYVDDIILITAKGSQFNFDKVESELSTLGLALNTPKTFNLRDPLCMQICFDYLGYSFIFDGKGTDNESLKIDISEKRLERYKQKIDLAFSAYQKTSGYGRKASKYLFLRIKFLVSNVRLIGEKNNIVSGVYYSNKLITSPSTHLSTLDVYLNSKIDLLSSNSLKSVLRQFSFLSSFASLRRNFFFLRRNQAGENKESKGLRQLLKIWDYVK